MQILNVCVVGTIDTEARMALVKFWLDFCSTMNKKSRDQDGKPPASNSKFYIPATETDSVSNFGTGSPGNNVKKHKKANPDALVRQTSMKCSDSGEIVISGMHLVV